MARTKRPTQNKAPARRKLKPLHVPKGSVSFGRHRRLCAICRHPDRFWIEHDFLHWISPPDIADRFQLPDRLTVYRHAHAVGLFALRRCNLRSALEFVLESAEEVQLTAHGLISAVRAYTQITDEGQWIEIPKRVIITHKRISKDAPPQPSGLKKDVPPVLNSPHTEELSKPPRPNPSPETAPPPADSSAPRPPTPAPDDDNAQITESVSESAPTNEDPINAYLQYGFYPGRMARRRARRYGAYQAADVPQSGDDT